MSERSYLRNCVIKVAPGDIAGGPYKVGGRRALFNQREDGSMYVYLDGYRIEPVEHREVLLEEMELLRVENERLRADKERLDWLEANSTAYDGAIEMEGLVFLSGSQPTLRAAIDGGRKEAEDGG
jgi:hypothetical protein